MEPNEIAADLRSIVTRRGPAVYAYCQAVCTPADARRATAEAFARFGAAMHAAPESSATDPEALLLGATRHAAASLALVPPPPTGARVRRTSRPQTCTLVPTLLAARAAGALVPADRERLARHLRRCERCRSVRDAFTRAEDVYAAPGRRRLTRSVDVLVMAAIREAVPIRDRPAPLATVPPAGELESAGALLPEPVFERDDAPPYEPVIERDDAAPAPAPEVATADGEPEPDVAEPLPADEEDEWADWDPDGDEVLPAAPTARDPAPTPQPTTAATLRRPRRERRASARRSPRLLALLLALAVAAAGVLVALAVADVFGGNEPTPTARNGAADRTPDPPATTPLPVSVPVAAPKRKAATTTAPVPPAQPSIAVAPAPAAAKAKPAPKSSPTTVEPVTPPAQPQDADPGVFNPGTATTP